jgi:hypothetical protein
MSQEYKGGRILGYFVLTPKKSLQNSIRSAPVFFN